MKKKIINLSPHDLVVMNEDGEEIITVKPCNKDPSVPYNSTVRIQEKRNKSGEINGIPLYRSLLWR